MRARLRRALVGLSLVATGCATGAGDGEPGPSEATPSAPSGPVVAFEAPLPPSAVPTAPAAAPGAAWVAGATDTGLHALALGLGAPAACRPGAFCDDFEDAMPGARWTSAFTDLGTLAFDAPSSSHGARALHATAPARNAAATPAAYLSVAGRAVGQTWVGFLAFALRVDALPVAALGGPELAVVDASGAVTRVGFSVRSDGIAVHQTFEACSGPACTARADLVADVRPGEWRRLTIGIETSGDGAAPYGRIEVTVDGGELLVLPLEVTPFDGSAEAHAGITVADVAMASLRVDDVVFFTR